MSPALRLHLVMWLSGAAFVVLFVLAKRTVDPVLAGWLAVACVPFGALFFFAVHRLDKLDG